MNSKLENALSLHSVELRTVDRAPIKLKTKIASESVYVLSVWAETVKKEAAQSHNQNPIHTDTNVGLIKEEEKRTGIKYFK